MLSRHQATQLALALALSLASACDRETDSCADFTSPVCADAFSGDIDAGPVDARVRDDANSDAFSIFDAWAPDAPPDAYVIPDAGSDGGICSRCPGATPACLAGTSCVQCTAADTRACMGATPACDVTTNTCVACVDDSTCPLTTPACNTTTRTCVACTATNATACSSSLGTPVCDTAVNRCVGCLNSTTCMSTAATPVCNTMTQTCAICTATERGACMGTQPDCDGGACSCSSSSCTSPTAARCNFASNACEACTVDTDCTNVAAPNNRRCVDLGGGAPRECRQCNVATETTDCPGGDSCNPVTHRCTGVMRGSRGTCLTCNADSECTGAAGGTATCAQVNILGVTGNYCLPRIPTPASFCAQPYADKQTATSASGTTVTYCRHATTTCEAFNHYRTTGNGTCTGGGGTDAACGTTTMGATNDGYCRLSGVGNRCTIPCNGDDDCRVGVLCNPTADMATGRNLCML